MSTFTICSKLIELCSVDAYYLCNILYVFVIDNGFKVALDDTDKVIGEYNNVIDCKSKYYNDIKRWIELLSFNAKNYEIVKNVEGIHNGNELFIHICNQTFDKKLIVNCKQDYLIFKSKINQIKIDLMDKDDAVQVLVKKGTYYQIKQTSHGSDSPNIIGDNN